MTFPVRTYDIDFAGIVSNIVYVRWLEDLRVRMLERFYPIEPLLERGEGPLLARTEIEYLRPVRFGSTVRGIMWAAGHGRAVFDLQADFEVAGETVARARQRGVFVHYGRMQVMPLPKELRSQMESAPAS